MLARVRLGTKRFYSSGSNPAIAFPCLDQHHNRSQTLLASKANPATSHEAEPAYANIVSGYSLFHHPTQFQLDYGGILPNYNIAYETWGSLNHDKTNAILLHTGLSASSHARSSTSNPAPGWWEKFIGPAKPIDTDKYFVICTNVIGGCYGSTGPSSLDPSDGKPYATRFPIISIFDMVRAQFSLLDHLGINTLHASVGSSMGGMQSIAAAHLFPERVNKVVSISGSARSSPSSIALRYAQRSVLMADPNWNRGFYYDGLPPHTGMKLARQIATITYRSGPEWEQRFGRQRRLDLPNAAFADPSSQGAAKSHPPALCPDFLIETYLDYQGEQFCLKYDANSLIYISKAMDLFDMSIESLQELEQSRDTSTSKPSQVISKANAKSKHISSLASSLDPYFDSLVAGLERLSKHPTLVIGVQSDALFPFVQQRELAEALRINGNKQVVYYELDSPMGHDSFLLDVVSVGGALRGFL